MNSKMGKLKKTKTSRQMRLCAIAKSKINRKDRRKPVAEPRSHRNVAAESAIAAPITRIDVVEVRKQIDILVTASAEKIANVLIKAAETGKLAEAKYLFEMIGLHPATHEAEFRPENSLAYRLLKRLGLPTEPVEQEQFSRGAVRVEGQEFPSDSVPPLSDTTAERMP
jgi:hypothetical protein